MKSNRYFELDRQLKKSRPKEKPSKKRKVPAQQTEAEVAGNRVSTGVICVLVALILAVFGLNTYLRWRIDQRSGRNTVDVPAEILVRGEAAHALHFVGRLIAPDGSPVAGRKIRFRSDTECVTDADGRFFLPANGTGDMLTEVFSEDGSTVACSRNFAVVRKDINGYASSLRPDGTVEISVAEDVRLLELPFEFDAAGGSLAPLAGRAATLGTSGIVITHAGTERTENGFILLPSDTLILRDGTLILPAFDGGKRITIGTDDCAAAVDAADHGSYSVLDDGSVVLPNGVKALPDGRTVGTSEEEIDPTDRGVLILPNAAVRAVGSSVAPVAEVVSLTATGAADENGVVASVTERLAEDRLFFGDDPIEKYYCVRASSESAARLFLSVKPTDDINPFADDATMIRITRWEADASGRFTRSALLYDGSLNGINSVDFRAESLGCGVSPAPRDYYFRVLIYPPYDAPDHYMSQSMKADLLWELIG